MLKMYRGGGNNRGQVMVLCALLIPLLFLFLGVALDLGWYYFNVSRLQNAADAAALAGAQELVARNNTLKGYKITLVDNKFAGYPEPDENIDTAESDKVAADYARKNLSSDDSATPLENDAGTYAYTMTDNWSPNSSEVTMTPHLGYNDEVFYYVVYLTEDIRHFLMPGRYEPIPAPVVAVATISKSTSVAVKHGIDLLTQLYLMDRGGTVIKDADGVVKVVLDVDGNAKVFNDEENEIKIEDGGKTIKIGDDVFKISDGSDGKLTMTLNGNSISDTKNKKVTITTDESNNDTIKVKDSPLTIEKRAPKVTPNWEDQNIDTTDEAKKKKYEKKTALKYYSGVWGEYQVGNNQIYKSSIGNYKTENVIVEFSKESTQGQSNPVKENELDSINLDFRFDVNFGEGDGTAPTEDWDLNSYDFAHMSPLNRSGWGNYLKSWTDPTGKEYGNYEVRNEDVLYRIHATFNFDAPFKNVREDGTLSEDILPARIESEPIQTAAGSGNKKSLNSVCQITININQSNTATDEETKRYKYRPVIMFYDGPETLNNKSGKWTYVENPNNPFEDSSVRVSKPVILNLNADYRGILFAPNSPVVILGNNHKLEGLVVAKEFVRLAAKEDFSQYEWNGDTGTLKDTNSSSSIPIKTRASGDDNYFEHKPIKLYKITDENGIEMIIDSWGNVQTEPLDNSYWHSTRPTNPNDTSWHSDEKVYKIEKFGLSSNSFYSTFNYDELSRTDYEYMDYYKTEDKESNPNKPNLTDMLFTAERAMHID